MAARNVQVSRATKETDITVALDPDTGATPSVSTGVPFFDHLLSAFAFHGGFGLALRGTGDIGVDAHHTVEDAGLLLGDAFLEVLSRGAVRRFGHAVIPMDEALSEVVVDVYGRPCLFYRASFPQPWAGAFDLSLLREFFSAFASRARVSLHAEVRRGENSHHMAESLFKAFGKALRQAYAPAGGEMSTKGVIG